MSNDGGFWVLLAVLALGGGLYLTFAPAKRPGRELTFWRRFLGVTMVFGAVASGLLMIAGAGLASVASH